MQASAFPTHSGMSHTMHEQKEGDEENEGKEEEEKEEKQGQKQGKQEEAEFKKKKEITQNEHRQDAVLIMSNPNKLPN